MDTKRVPVAQLTPAVPKAGITSKTNVGKTTSEASMTPSQMAAAEAARARKHPLDALSRSVFNRSIEKRSGLQDVDDEFLKQNFFARPGYGRHSGLNDGNLYGASMQNQHAAGQPSGMAQNAALNAAAMHQQQQQMVAQVPMDTGAPGQFVPLHAVPVQQPPMVQQPQAQMLQQPIQPQLPQQVITNQVAMAAAGQPSGMVTPATLNGQPGQGHVQSPHLQSSAQMHAPSQPHMHQVPVSPSQTNAMPQTMPQQQQQILAQQPAPVVPQQQMQQPNQHQSPVQQQPEPDMCTTCPNCQTTIYLVRPDVPEMQQIQQAVN